MDLQRLIDCYRVPITFVPLYQGDIAGDTIEALQDLDALQDADGSDVYEVFTHLPEKDDLDELIDVLEDALEVNKPEMIAGIKKALELIVAKRDKYAQTRDDVHEEYIK